MEYNNKTKFTQNEEELEYQKKEILLEMNKLDNEIRTMKKKKIIIISSIIIVIFVYTNIKF